MSTNRALLAINILRLPNVAKDEGNKKDDKVDGVGVFNSGEDGA